MALANPQMELNTLTARQRIVPRQWQSRRGHIASVPNSFDAGRSRLVDGRNAAGGIVAWLSLPGQDRTRQRSLSPLSSVDVIRFNEQVLTSATLHERPSN